MLQWPEAAWDWPGAQPLVASGPSWGSGTSLVGNQFSGMGSNPLSLGQGILWVSVVAPDMAMGWMHGLYHVAIYLRCCTQSLTFQSE